MQLLIVYWDFSEFDEVGYQIVSFDLMGKPEYMYTYSRLYDDKWSWAIIFIGDNSKIKSWNGNRNKG